MTTNATTPPTQQESHTEETKPIQQDETGALWKAVDNLLPTAEQFIDGLTKFAKGLVEHKSDGGYVDQGSIELIGMRSEMLFDVDGKSATDTQVGGNHYTKLAIQPMRYSMENRLDALQHTVIKYVTRFRDKNGIEDLEKAKHCIDMLIEFERGKK